MEIVTILILLCCIWMVSCLRRIANEVTRIADALATAGTGSGSGRPGAGNAGMFAGTPTAWMARRAEREKQYRREHHLCIKCGYDLRASKDRCPECGEVIST